MRLCFPQRHLQRSIGATIFGAFVAMGLLTAALGAYGIYVLTAAGNFVVDLYDRPLMATNFERAAAVDFAQMDKELARRDRADEPGRAAIDARISRLSRVFSEDLAVAESRSLSDEERLAIDQIELLVAKWNELRLGNAQTAPPTSSTVWQPISRIGSSCWPRRRPARALSPAARWSRRSPSSNTPASPPWLARCCCRAASPCC